VQELILRRVVPRSVTFSFLRLDWHHQHAAETDAQEKFAPKSHCAISLLRIPELRERGAGFSSQKLSASLKSIYPFCGRRLNCT
jgi:hypothetical protein